MSENVKINKDLEYGNTGPNPSGWPRVTQRVRNNSGGTLAAGDIVIWQTNVTYPAVTTTTSADDEKVAGMVMVACGNGEPTKILRYGFTNDLKVDGTTDIAVGDVISTFTTAKIGQKRASGKGGGFALAYEAYTTNDSAGVIDAFIDVGGFGTDASGTVTYGTAGQMAADGLAAANAAGSTAATARIDHAHTATADTPALVLGTTNTAGTAGSVLAANASIAIFDSTVPGTIQPDASASAGSAAVAARRDHQHAIVSGAPIDGSLAAANAEGTDNDFARTDHEHRALVLDDVEFEFGTGYDATIGWETGDASNHSLVIGLGASNALHILEKADIAADLNLAADTNPTLRIHAAVTPITEYVEIFTDETDAHLNVVGTAGLDIDVPTSQKVSIQVNNTDEFNFHATEFEVGAANNIQFLGDNGILDSGANELLEFSATASATNGLLIKNSATGDPVIISAQGTGATANRGIRFNDSNGNEALVLASVASALNELTVTNSATGAQVLLSNNGEDDIGFLFNAKNAEEMLSLKATAAATTYVEVLSMSTGATGPAIKALGETNVNLRLMPNGTGQLDVSPGTAGTAAAPDIIIGGDADSGLFGGTNLVGVATSGAQRVLFLAAGGIIVGTTTSTTFTGNAGSMIFDEITAPAGTATNQAQIYAYDSATVTVMAQQKSDGTNADL